MRTRITELFGIRCPIVQGAMQWLSRAPLAAAVSNAGGLGTLNVTSFQDARALGEEIETLRGMTSRPFAVNLSMLPDTKIEGAVRDFIDMMLALRVPVIETAGRDPTDLVPLLHSAGAAVVHKVSDVRHAQKAQEAGVEAVTIVGQECGGHPGMGGVGSMVLWPKTAQVLDIPVIGGGGVCDGRTLYAALALGLEGVTVGTRFLMSEEAGLGPNLRRQFLRAEETDTVLTQRSIRNALRSIDNAAAREILRMEEEGASFEALYPHIRGSLTRLAYEADDGQAAQIAIGQVIGRIHDVRPAGQIVAEMVEEAEQTARRMGGILRSEQKED